MQTPQSLHSEETTAAQVDSPPSLMLIRLSLLVFALVLLMLGAESQKSLWESATFTQNLSKPQQIAGAVYTTLFSGMGLGLLLLSMLIRSVRRINSLILGVFLLTCILNYAAALNTIRPYGSDNATAPHYAAELLLQGKNPYGDYSVSAATARFGLPTTYITLTRDGVRWEYYVYPAGSFLVVAPFVAAGMSDLRPVYAAALLAMYLLLFFKAPTQYKAPVLAIALLHNLFNLNLVIGGLPEPTWALPVLCTLFVRRRVVVAALLFGIALCLKQLAGLFLLFYLAYVWRTQGRRETAIAAAIPTGIFLGVNLPFMVTAPQLWFEGVVGLAFAPFPVLAEGPAMLGSLLMPWLPGVVYTTLALVILLGSFFWYALSPRAPLLLAWIIPLAPLWFAWRSLFTYFYLLPLFALAVFLIPTPVDNSSETVEEGILTH